MCEGWRVLGKVQARFGGVLAAGTKKVPAAIAFSHGPFAVYRPQSKAPVVSKGALPLDGLEAPHPVSGGGFAGAELFKMLQLRLEAGNLAAQFSGGFAQSGSQTLGVLFRPQIDDDLS